LYVDGFAICLELVLLRRVCEFGRDMHKHPGILLAVKWGYYEEPALSLVIDSWVAILNKII
jgi:hypothetical protein